LEQRIYVDLDMPVSQTNDDYPKFILLTRVEAIKINTPLQGEIYMNVSALEDEPLYSFAESILVNRPESRILNSENYMYVFCFSNA
jgi:hypothetical protein